MKLPQPHTLLWLDDNDALQGFNAPWVAQQWRPALPVVVRRDVHPQGLVPVGVRGLRRSERAAGWVNPACILRSVTPEMLVDMQTLQRSAFVSSPPLQAAIQLIQRAWPWRWGIAGSVGYALATEIPVIHADSDLDLLIRAPQRPEASELARWQAMVTQLPCRADTQIETPLGGFALTEWLREGRALLKTARGPRLVADPWVQEAE